MEATKQGDAALVERAVEVILAEPLRRERDRIGVDQETDKFFAEALEVFEAWCSAYGLRTDAHAMAAFLVELRERYNRSLADCELFATAFMYAHAWDVGTPVRAALRFCREIPHQVVH
jgi:hypothetical protein